MSKHNVKILIILTSLLILSYTVALKNFSDEIPANHPRRTTHGMAFQLKQFQLKTGSEEEAKKYYQETVTAHLAFLTPETILGSTLKDLLQYFGYTNISTSDLHGRSSEE